jgi:hypothetical protein
MLFVIGMSTRDVETARQHSSAPRFAVLPGGEHCDSQADRAGRRADHGGVLVALAVALIAVVASLSSAGDPSIRDLPAKERGAVAERALQNLRDVCQGTDRPRDFCRAQAELLRGVPECDAACRALAREVVRADMARR